MPWLLGINQENFLNKWKTENSEKIYLIHVHWIYLLRAQHQKKISLYAKFNFSLWANIFNPFKVFHENGANISGAKLKIIKIEYT